MAVETGNERKRDKEREMVRRPEEGPEEGSALRKAQIREGDEFAITGNARQRGEDPSPDDRGRGETSIKDPAPPVDINR